MHPTRPRDVGRGKNITYNGSERVYSSGAAWESRWPSWVVPPNEPSGFCGRKAIMIEPCFGIGHSLSLICQLTSEDIKYHFIIIGLSGLPKIPALGKFCRSQPVLTAGRWRWQSSPECKFRMSVTPICFARGRSVIRVRLLFSSSNPGSKLIGTGPDAPKFV